MDRDTNESLDDFYAALQASELQIEPPDPKVAANSGYVYCYFLKITAAGAETISRILKSNDILTSVACDVRQSIANTRSILLSCLSTWSIAKVGESRVAKRGSQPSCKVARTRYGASVPYGGDAFLRTCMQPLATLTSSAHGE